MFPAIHTSVGQKVNVQYFLQNIYYVSYMVCGILQTGLPMIYFNNGFLLAALQ